MIRMKFTFTLEYEITDDAVDRAFDRRGERGVPPAALGFHPAFLDFQTFTLYSSRYSDGALTAGARLIPGFERGGYFYTRTAAARAAREWAVSP
jgi:hypothetical protein